MVRVRLATAQRLQKEAYDRSAVERKFTLGDRVWLLVPAIKPGTSRKFARLWQGPFVIEQKLSDVVLRVCETVPPYRQQIVHVNRVKPCYTRPVRLTSVPEDDTPRPPRTPALTSLGTASGPATAPAAPQRYIPDDTDRLYADSDDDCGEFWTATEVAIARRPQRARRAPERLGDYVQYGDDVPEDMF